MLYVMVNILMVYMTWSTRSDVTVTGATIVNNGTSELMAIKVESTVLGYTEDGGSAEVEVGMTVNLYLIGEYLNRIVYAIFVTGELCNDTQNSVNVQKDKLIYIGEYEMMINDLQFTETKDYGLCLAYQSQMKSYIGHTRMRIRSQNVQKEFIMGSLGFQLGVVVFLAMLSGLFSGLNLGLMSLNPEELELVQTAADDENHRNYAKTILPIRQQGNYLLCSLLLGNVIVNTAMSILFGDIVDSFQAICISTMVIVMFGEIIPQSVCQKYSLAIGAKTIYLTMFFMILTGPISYPIGKLLDVLLQHEYSRTYQRERLSEIMKEQIREDLAGQKLTPAEEQEMRVVQGVMQYANKTVKDVMTDVKDVFMLEENEVLDRNKIAKISLEGFTRIPVYERKKDKIIYILNVKDLALYDPDDKLPVAKIAKIWGRFVTTVEEDNKLPTLLETLKTGDSNMAIVKNGKTVTGVVTLEDVVEEILGLEIRDETDANPDPEQTNKAKTKSLKKKRYSETKRIAKKILGPC